MRPVTTPANKRLRWAFIVLVAIGIALNGAVLVAFAIVHADVCTFATQVAAGAHELPQTPGRVRAEQAYAHLQDQLRCH